MTKIYIDKTRITVVTSEHYIEKTKNSYSLCAEFSDVWYGLEKRIVFKTDHSEEIVTTQAQTLTFIIPVELFAQPSNKFLIGVYGYQGCELVLNTKFAKLGKIEKGVNPETPDSSTSEAIVGIPPGGTVNQVLSKKSDADGDVYWRDAITSIFLSAPVGTIVAYTGKVEDIPASYAICDGTNGTPDLRNAFIIGAGGYYEPGDTNRLDFQSHLTKTDYDPIDPNTADIGFYSLCFIQKLYFTDLDKKESMTAYEIAVQQGFQGDENEWLESLKGKSAYQIAVGNGFEGTESEWLASLGQELPKVEDLVVTAKNEFPVTESGCYLFRNVYFVSYEEHKKVYPYSSTVFRDEIVYVNVEDPKCAKITNINNDLITVLYAKDETVESITIKSLVEQILSSIQTVQGEPGKSAYQLAVDKGFAGTETEWLESLKGPPGKDGPRGKDGAVGPPGKDGRQGRDGETGADGLSAYQIALKNGYTESEQQWLASLKGKDGQNGSRGPQGLPGSDGKQGPAGEDGKSAYQLALSHGFRGSEAEWIESLKGVDGKNGKDGKDGTNGLTGPEGKRGPSGESAYDIAVKEGFQGSKTEWLESLKGTNGKNGRDGINGSDGETAYQIAVRNGFVGSEREWLTSLHGKDGEDGTNGLNGLSAYELAVRGGYEGTLDQWLKSLHGKDGKNGLSAYEVAVEQGFTGTKDEWLASIAQDLTGVYRFKGSVASYETLPTENLTVGDVYDTIDTGMNYAWDGDAWDPLGATFKVDSIEPETIDAILNGDDPNNYDKNTFLNPVGLAHLKDKLDATPPGLIAMFAGSKDTLPKGWVFCDGENGTPDLRGRFILGNSSEYQVGSTGGSKNVTLEVVNIPAHSHTYAATSLTYSGDDGGSLFTAGEGVLNGSSTSKTTGQTGSIDPTPISTMPPYYVLAYIMKISGDVETWKNYWNSNIDDYLAAMY